MDKITSFFFICSTLSIPKVLLNFFLACVYTNLKKTFFPLFEGYLFCSN